MTIQRRTFLAAGAAFAISGAPRVLAQGATSPDPAALTLNRVTAQGVEYRGRRAVRIELTDAQQRAVLAGGPGGGNAATMALLPGEFRNFAIEADIAAEVNGKGAPDSRGFAGFAFRATGDGARFEAIYLRMTNGTRAEPRPPAPRDVRAVQYVAHPDFHFDVSRARAPGIYEKGAPVAPATWHRARMAVDGARARFWIDGTEVLDVTDLRSGPNASGRAGLYVDDGTTAYFANLTIGAL